MNQTEFDIAIIGGGCVGSSIAFHLMQRGFKNVVLVDNGRKTISATSQSGGMMRVFHESPDHINLALGTFHQTKKLASLGILRNFPSANGSLYFFDRRRFRDYESNLEIMETNGYPFEVVTSKNGQSRFPMFQWTPNLWAIYEPLGSHLSTTQFCGDLLKASQLKGLSLIDDFEVERICFFRDRHRLLHRDCSIQAKTLILAGGARAVPHLRELGIGHSLKVTPLTVYKSNETYDGLTIPNFLDRETLQFGGLVRDGHLILSNLTTERLIQSFSEENFQHVSALDSYAPQRAGYAGFLTGHPRLMLATGWGGTAFKFSLEIGHRISQALENQSFERSTIHA